MTHDRPVKRKKFEIPHEFRNHLSSLEDKEAADGIRELCKQVEELVEKLGISDQCFAFVTDGDLAITWGNYWTVDRRATKSTFARGRLGVLLLGFGLEYILQQG